MTTREDRFAEEYPIDLNGKQAAIRAGYSPKTAEQIASRLLRKVKVKEAIEKALAERSEKTKIDAEYVLKQAVKLHERCMQEIEPFTDRKGNHLLDENGRPIYIFNSSGAAKALELVGKHVNIQAFQDNVNMNVTDNLAERLGRAKGRVND